MSFIGFVRCAVEAGCRRRTQVRFLSVPVVAGLLAVGAASAWAQPATTASATIAPAGGSTYVLTVTNNALSALTSFYLNDYVGLYPDPPCSNVAKPKCVETIEPGASAKVCVTGSDDDIIVIASFADGSAETFEPTLAPAVSGCPFHIPAPSCIVPSLVGRTLAFAKSAIVGSHCTVGKIKKATSNKVPKGEIISQSPKARKSLPAGTKVSFVISKGK